MSRGLRRWAARSVAVGLPFVIAVGGLPSIRHAWAAGAPVAGVSDAALPPSLPRPLPLPDEPVGAADPSGPVGVLPGGGEVSAAGDYSYSIPLAVPAGRAGMQPALSLEYSSQGGDSPVGYGWSVSGMSSITRCPRTFAQDGTVSTITFDKNVDRFCLDGQRLVLVGSVGGAPAEYGGINAEYRTETDSFAQIVSLGSPATIGAGPDQFVVRTKDGRVMLYQAYFAEQVTSAVQASGAALPPTSEIARPVTWLLASVKDRSGNEIRYEYLPPPAYGEAVFLPWKIHYTYGTGQEAFRMVEFVWVDRAAEDRPVSFRAGVRATMTKRLDKIQMWAPNPFAKQVVWFYDLDHKLSVSKRTMLGSVRRCGHLGSCLQAKKFSYGDPAGPTFIDRLVATNEGLSVMTEDKPQLQVLDLNDDGATDVIYSRGQVVGQPPGKLAPHYVRLGTRTETGAVPLGIRYSDANLLTSSRPVWQMRGADIDGNGTTEIGVPLILGGLPPTRTVEFFGWDDAQKAFGPANKAVPGGHYTELADLTGDGRLDVLPITEQGAAPYTTFGFSARVNTGSGFTTAPQSQSFDYGCPIRITDLDGDGRQEVVGNPRMPLQDLPIEVDEEEGIESWPGKQRGAPRPTHPTMDVRCRNGSETKVLRLDAAGQLVVGSGYGIQNGLRAYKVPPMDMTNQTTALGDFNGDGLLDALLAPRGGGTARVVFNTGSGLVAGPTTQVPTGGTGPTGVVYQPDLRVGDIDGDGDDDVIALSPTGITLKLAAGDGTFRDGPLAPYSDAGASVGDRGRTMTQLGDFNADGQPDLVRWNVLGEIRIMEQTSAPTADRLLTVTDDGVALPQQSVTYARTWSERPDKFRDSLCGYPLACQRAGMVVARETRSYAHLTSPSQAGDAYVLQYSFEDPVFNLRGRGALGFGTFRVWDRQRPAETITTYQNRAVSADELYGLAGLPKIVQTAVPILTPDKAAQQPTSVTARVTRVVNAFEVKKINNGKTYALRGPDSLTREWEEQATVTWGALAGTKTEHISDIQVSPSPILRTSSTDLTYSEDNYGNIVGSASSTTGGVSESVVTSYDNRPSSATDPTLWLIGLPTVTTVTSTAADGAKVTRTAEKHYDQLGRLDTEWVEKANPDPSVRSTTTYQLDPDGVLRGTVTSSPMLVTGQKMPDRVTRLEYDRPFGAAQPDERIYPSQAWSQHAPAQYRPSVWTVTHPAYGVPVVNLDINGVASVSTYDDLGRLRTSTPDGATTTTVTAQPRIVSGAVNGSIVTATSANGTTKTQVDKAGRTVEAAVKAFDGSFSATTTGYDRFGRAVTVTSPAPGGTVVSTFDSLDRLTRVTDAAGKISTFDHTFLSTTSKDPNLFERKIVRDLDGRTITAIDRLAKPGQPVKDIATSYVFAPFDQIKKVTDDRGNTTTMGYDVRGRQVQLIEPDRGTTTTAYFGTGEPLTETHLGSGHGTTFDYDDLGRVISAVTEDGESVFTWDTAAHGIGKLAYDDSPDGIRTTYRYDTAGRSAGTDYTDSTVSPAETYSVDNHYDNAGRLYSRELPGPAGISRFALQYDYNGSGQLAAVRYAPPGTNVLQPLWDIQSRKPNGALGTATLGTGPGMVTLTNYYQPGTARLTGQIANKGSATIHDRSYGYYDNGLMKWRFDSTSEPSRTENFRYDTLSRLTGWDIVLPPPNSNQEDRTIETAYDYDTIDNLTSITRTDYAAVATQTRGYGKPDGTQPHTLTSVNGPNSQAPKYDSEGRQTTGSGRGVTYTAFDLPRTIVKGGQTTTYRYDANGRRVKETGPGGTTFYGPGGYEKRTTGAGTKHIYRLPGVEGALPQAVFDGTGTAIGYQYTDALGSVSTAADAAGTVTGRYLYDPYGLRINVDGTPYTGGTGDAHHGFTGHEHDDDLNLINMKGRVEDPGLSTFLTPDPLNTTGANPYSYVNNSPLNYTDPSGFRACSDGMLKGKHQYTGDECNNLSGKGINNGGAAAQSAWLSAGHSTWMGCNASNCTFPKPSVTSDSARPAQPAATAPAATKADVAKYVTDTWGFLNSTQANVWADDLTNANCLEGCTSSAHPGGNFFGTVPQRQQFEFEKTTAWQVFAIVVNLTLIFAPLAMVRVPPAGRPPVAAAGPKAPAARPSLMQQAIKAGAVDELDLAKPTDMTVVAHGTTSRVANQMVETQGGNLSSTGGNYGGKLHTTVQLEVAEAYAATSAAKVGDLPAVVGIAMPRALASTLQANGIMRVSPMTGAPVGSNPQQWVFSPGAIQAIRDGSYFFIVK